MTVCEPICAVDDGTVGVIDRLLDCVEVKLTHLSLELLPSLSHSLQLLKFFWWLRMTECVRGSEKQTCGIVCHPSLVRLQQST